LISRSTSGCASSVAISASVRIVRSFLICFLIAGISTTSTGFDTMSSAARADLNSRNAVARMCEMLCRE
jgi:hypothetical protein